MPADKCLSAAVSYCTVALQTALFVGVVAGLGCRKKCACARYGPSRSGPSKGWSSAKARASASIDTP
jgi:hypothetical protein